MDIKREILYQNKIIEIVQHALLDNKEELINEMNLAVERKTKLEINLKNKIIPLKNLTQKEKTIFMYLIKGYDSEYIAKKECISENTLKKHKTSIYRKNNVKNRIELISKLKMEVQNG